MNDRICDVVCNQNYVSGGKILSCCWSHGIACEQGSVFCYSYAIAGYLKDIFKYQ